jgi:DNA polymerase III epsilon subunit-like protein
MVKNLKEEFEEINKKKLKVKKEKKEESLKEELEKSLKEEVEKSLKEEIEKSKFSLKSIQNHFDEIHYNPEQLQFIHAPLESSTLLGTPGCGKSSTIIGKIIYLFLNKVFTKTNQYKLFTFSKRACSDFIEKGRKIHSRIFQKNSISTLHSVSGKLLYYMTQKQSASKNSVIMSALYLFDKQNVENVEHYNLLKSYDGFNNCKVIFVDEAQDISDIQYKLIMKIGSFYEIPVIMIGDPNQNIYQFQNGSDKYLLEHSGPKYYLIRNYRSTPEIVNVINSMRPWDDLTPKMISAHEDLNANKNKITSYLIKKENKEDEIEKNFKKPHIIVDNVPNIIKNIIHKIRNLNETQGIGLEEMAIIGPVKKSKPNGEYYTNIGLSLFTNIFHNENIPYVKHYEDGADGGDDIDREIQYKDGHINLFTIHGSKGLEFKVVFLINFHLNTFGISPTEEDYNRFKYLWYVGLSRAAEHLHIYIDERKYGFFDLKNVRLQDVIYETKFPKLLPKLEFKDQIKPLVFTVTEILRNKKYMNDKLYHFFYEAFGPKEVTKVTLWNNKTLGLPDFYELENMDFYKIYGIFMEHIFNFYYHCAFECENKMLPDFVLKIEKMIKNRIELPKKYNQAFGIFKLRYPEIAKECITLSIFNNYKNILSPCEIEMYSHLCALLDNDYHKEFYLQIENNVISIPRTRLLEKISYIRDYFYNIPYETHNTILYESIFELAIFVYQYENEASYLWKSDLNIHIDKLEKHIKHISQFAIQTYNENKSAGNEYIYTFHKKYIHKNLPIVGELDMINKDTIVDLKFSHSNVEKYIDQICMYSILHDPSFGRQCTMNLELWNILKGEKLIIKLDKNKINKVLLLQILCKAVNQKLQNMCFIYDLETTGLTYTNQTVDIIERHVEEYHSRSVWSSGLVIPQTVPFIPFEVTKITGITKELVYESGEHINVMKAEFENIFKYCEKPTFIAHNGNSFDHKILIQKEILKEGECKLLDSRYLLRLLINNPKIAEKSLGEIYTYYYPNEGVVGHRAENDVIMLIKIFQKLGLEDYNLE